jgi:hypothetical protein
MVVPSFFLGGGTFRWGYHPTPLMFFHISDHRTDGYRFD